MNRVVSSLSERNLRPPLDNEEAMDDRVKAAIGGIAPKDYTRMGAPIRHFSRMLQQVEARTKLLITISDGKPDDYDHYYRGNMV